MKHRLSSKSDVAPAIARLAERGDPLSIEVREEKCFDEGKWVELGTIALDYSVPEMGETLDDIRYRAVRLGQFIWSIPSQEEVVKSLNKSYADHAHRHIPG